MDSINPEINAMHWAYCEALGYEFPLLPNMERGWSDALKIGMTPECVRMVVKDRQARIKAGVRKPECLMFRNIAGSEEAIGDVMQEAAAIRAKMRVKVVDSGKAQVLRATGRSAEPEQSTAKPISEYIEALRKAVG